jgi:hypothetical protein
MGDGRWDGPAPIFYLLTSIFRCCFAALQHSDNPLLPSLSSVFSLGFSRLALPGASSTEGSEGNEVSEFQLFSVSVFQRFL